MTRFPVRVKFKVDKDIIEGNIYDISRFGLCFLSNTIDKFSIGDLGELDIWRIDENVISLPGTLRWAKIVRSSCFYGIETKDSLYNTELKNYLE